MLIRDYTRLTRRQNRLYSFGGIPLGPDGLSVPKLAAAGIVLGALSVVLIPLGALLWQSLGGVLGLVAAGVGAVVAYFVAGNDIKFTQLERSLVNVDFLFVQPKRSVGFSRDSEPQRIHWQASPWLPDGDEWMEAYRLHLRSELAEPDVDEVATHRKLLELHRFVTPLRRHP